MNEFDASNLPELPGFESGHTDRPSDARPETLENASHARRAAGREYLQALGVANAAAHLRALPKPGVSLHAIVKGNYPLFDTVGAILRIIAPAAIDELWLATLGFSMKNANNLFAMLDDGDVRRVRVLCSCYFRSLSAEIYNPMAAGLEKRGHEILAMRTHAKIILASTSAGHFITIESSANLRSCRNVEQFVLTNDAGLYEFHRGWMQQLFREKPHAR
ncbi:MAG TPA: hypothetical protein VHQ47_18010 [Phycisphaerae bacterium]|jgi:hypothetical protein|nr:hypothetical protein [Phycisphaerae bacterium]